MTLVRDWFTLSILLAAGVAVLSGCASIGHKSDARKRLIEASDALQQARDAGAPVHAKAEMAEAETAYRGAGILFEQKNYDEARKLAAKAAQKAKRAGESANANRSKRKDDSGGKKAVAR